MDLIIHGVRILETGGPDIEHGWVGITGNKITAVEDGSAPPANAKKVIDGNGATVLPGLIDMHTHMSYWYILPDSHDYAQERGEFLGTLLAAKHMRESLAGGVTTIRDVGSQYHIGTSIRNAISDNWIPGPRCIVSGNLVCMTGGHGSPLEGMCLEVDGVAEARQAVRQLVHSGVDIIKLATTHRTETPEFTQEELNAIVDESHRFGKKVVAHAALIPGLEMAIEAGVDTIEHGTFLEKVRPQYLEQMAERQTPIIPTMFILKYLLRFADQARAEGRRDMIAQFTLLYEDYYKRSLEASYRAVQLAKAVGIPIAAGTDHIFTPLHFAQVHEEIMLLHDAGLTTKEAIAAATSVAARACGRDDLGTVRPGVLADLIVVDGDPRDDLTCLRRLRHVVFDGVVDPVRPVPYESGVGVGQYA